MTKKKHQKNFTRHFDFIEVSKSTARLNETHCNNTQDYFTEEYRKQQQ